MAATCLVGTACWHTAEQKPSTSCLQPSNTTVASKVACLKPRFIPLQRTVQAASPKLRLRPTAAAVTDSAVGQPSIQTSDGVDTSMKFTLQGIRQDLIRQEDTIIFGLIERAQFAQNDAVYTPDAIPIPAFQPDGHRQTLLEYMLRETEQIHGKVRRFTSPDEHPFYPESIPALVLPPITYPQVLTPYSKEINLNSHVMNMYLEHLLPGITQPGDDSNYGSAAMYDVHCLQALSRRIHYGKFVAEAKFQQQPDKYTELIKARDSKGIMDLLTDRAVELRVLERVKQKAATFGQDIDPSNKGEALAQCKVSPSTVADLYDQWVMPLTKDVEVQYLLRRLECPRQL